MTDIATESAATPTALPATDTPEPKPSGRATKPNVAPTGAKASKSASQKKKAAKPAPKAKAKPKGALPAKAAKPTSPRDGSKTAKILTLLRRPGGATLKELMKASGWQAHSVRGFLSAGVAKKMGLKLISEKAKDGERTYAVKG